MCASQLATQTNNLSRVCDVGRQARCQTQAFGHFSPQFGLNSIYASLFAKTFLCAFENVNHLFILINVMSRMLPYAISSKDLPVQVSYICIRANPNYILQCKKLLCYTYIYIYIYLYIYILTGWQNKNLFKLQNPATFIL